MKTEQKKEYQLVIIVRCKAKYELRLMLQNGKWLMQWPQVLARKVNCDEGSCCH
jgi:1,2-phenylacetyl-CoA epoxidase catalytic subunit